MTDTETEAVAYGSEPEGFIEPVSMEDDPTELFVGDRGVLDADVRRVLVQLLRRRFITAERSPRQWRTLLDHQAVIESRLHDLFVRLVVDHDRGIAYKRQVRSEELDVPVLLKDDAYSRAETLVLVHLRTVFQRERGAGQSSARVDADELEQTVLTYFDVASGDAAPRREIRRAVERLAREGLLEEESEDRYRITPLVEIVLSVEKLTELKAWLRDPTGTTRVEVAVEAEEPDDADDLEDPKSDDEAGETER
ncbi:DUF4194 domain-containing protein [Nocardioides luteus]|uniref:DUF4194 domain-containing protein n=1 Tax=Nocardioides luteus TaxID=1844 RepID=UPI001A1A9C0D|nr:DUF4194 domain-containing protein [Nocardioides luteus]MBG6096663.1 hypothetical protein [Nocardioides luteus]